MAGEIDQAYERVLDNLPPDDWKIVGLTNTPDGWLVTAARVWYTGRSGEATYYPRVDAKAGSLSKALSRLADGLAEYNATRT